MKRLYLVLAIFFIFAAGCSGGGSNPVAPEKTQGSSASLPIISPFEVDGVSQATGLFGAYELTINPENLTAELTSKRMGAVGDSYIVSGVSFFTIVPCADCLQIVGVSLDLDGNAWLKFEVRHPFDPGVSTLPPSAANRNDLDVFDLAMVIHPIGATAQAFAQSSVSAYNATCVGAAGYTTELANFVSDTAALPYFLCVDDSIDASPPASTFNIFPMGGDTTFEVGFDLTGGTLAFDAYITMGYGHSAVKMDRLTPKYWNPEFNRKAAWKVDVDAPTGTVTPGSTWDLADSFPQDVIVNVYDWQIGATVATGDFADSASDQIFAASDPTTVTVEVLGMSTTLPSATAPDDPLATGEADDPWVYTIPVPNDLIATVGTYPGLVAVTDSRVPVGIPPTATNDHLIDSPDGILLDFYEIPAFVTYNTFWANVIVACGPITGSITSPVCPITTLSSGSTIAFVVAAASDNGGTVTGYDADWDYDGITFDIDASDPTGDFPSGGPFVNPNCGTPPEDPVTITVAFRATDDCSVPNETIFATCDVTIDICQPPIHSILYEPKADVADTYYDIGVQADGYALVLADHPSTGNSAFTRTALRFDNDLTNMTVLQPGTGLVDRYGYAMTPHATRLDVTDAGYMYMPCYGGWLTINDITTIPPTDMLLNAWAVTCGQGLYGSYDTWNQESAAFGQAGAQYEVFPCGVTYEASYVYRDSPPPTSGASCWSLATGLYWTIGFNEIVGIDGLDNSDNAVFLKSSVLSGLLSVSSNWFCAGVPAQIASIGSLGTSDQQFTGGLDVAVDLSDNIITLEDLGGSTYRFQKFNWDGSIITWEYTSTWSDTGNPKRIDCNRGSGTYADHLYLISDTGVHIMEVD